MVNLKTVIIKAFLLLSLMSIYIILNASESKKESISMEVLATAYNSVPEQTDDSPFEAAWGDILDPEVKSIAVSADLLQLGLKKNTKVKIKGLPGEYLVLDKMNSRWEKKIDIYMGTDIQKAKKWGIKKVIIQWTATPTN